LMTVALQLHTKQLNLSSAPYLLAHSPCEEQLPVVVMQVLKEPKHCGILTALGLVVLGEAVLERTLEEVMTVSAAPAERCECRAAAALLQWEMAE